MAPAAIAVLAAARAHSCLGKFWKSCISVAPALFLRGKFITKLLVVANRSPRGYLRVACGNSRLLAVPDANVSISVNLWSESPPQPKFCDKLLI